MIQKTNANLSFKKAYILPSIENIKPENGRKVDAARKMIDFFFPENDVFIGADARGELNYHIEKNNKLMYLSEPEYYEKMNLNIDEFVDLVQFVNIFNYNHKALWGKTEILIDKTKNLSKMSTLELLTQFSEKIDEFNKKYNKNLS